MTRFTKRTITLVLIGSLLAFGIVFAQGNSWNNKSAGTATATPQVKAALLEALTGPEGEYAAYAMYAAVIDKYGDVEPYVTIQNAEARHIEALERQLDRYGIDYPSENPYIGKVTAPDSLEAAATAWADGENANVKMYDRLLAQIPADEYPNVARVFENLRRASLEAHLPMFQAAAQNGGTLTLEQMQTIAPQLRNGRGNGHAGQGPTEREHYGQGRYGHGQSGRGRHGCGNKQQEG